jgi:TonB-dependent SusC/RagA subfamily outer membrane receptor
MHPYKPVPSWLSLTFAVVFFAATGFGDEDLQLRKIGEAIEKFTILYPQQKVYLHLDKAGYIGGDMIWVKAYVLNGLNHLPDTLSTNLYVELISPSQTRVEIKRFQLYRGFGIGDFQLSDTLPEGLYQIRAFTSWMQNFDEGFYFNKNFPLVNPLYSKRISPKQARVNQKELNNREKMADQIDLQFMPEGGVLVDDLSSTVGFKAINQLGMGVDVSGNIVDDKGNVITSFASFFKGIGKFIFTPQKGKKYVAVVKTGNNEMRYPLPKPIEIGLVMHVENSAKNLTVTLQANKPSTNDRTANEVILVGQIGGKIYYRQSVQLENNAREVVVNKSYFPSGIMQLTAFSGRGMPLAERLIFNNRLDYMKIRMTASDTLVDEGNKLLLSFSVTDQANNPLPANMSLSVTREKSTMPRINSDNIISHLLVTSDLKGFVEDPYEYFADNSPFHQQALDNLMLTNGWRRFDWAKILSGIYPEIKYHEERGIAIYGQITYDFFNIPVKNCKVQLSILSSYNDVFTQYTNDKGYFMFENLSYFDTVKVKIEAWRPNGRRNVQIDLPDDKVNEIRGFQGDYSLVTASERDNKAYRIERFTETKEALDKEQKRLKEENNNQLHDIYNEPDYVLHSSDIPKGSRDIVEVMKGRIPGVNIYGDQIIIRGPNSLTSSMQPLFLIDGVPTRDIGAIRAIPVDEIDRVEVLKGPSAAIYGMRGSNGVIAIYTKRGQFMKRGVIEFDMLGYSTPRNFYQPKYTPENEPQTNYTILWQPLLITNSGGTTSILLDKPAVKGDYRFVVEGVSYMGHVGMLDEVVNNE